MSDMSISSRANESQKQLDELKAENERKLSQLRSDQQRKESEIEASGEAAISHIKRRVDHRIENTREESERKLSRENESIQNNYVELKKRAGHQTQSLEKQVAAERERAAAAKAGLRAEENRTFRQSQSKIKEFLQNQDELRAQAQKQTTHSVDRYQKSANEKLGETREKYSAELRETETEGQAKINETKTRSDQVYNHARAEADRRIKELKALETNRIGKETSEGEATIHRVRDQVKQTTLKEERDGQRRLAQLSEENKKRVEQNRNRSLALNEKLQAEYSNEGQRIESEGTQDINARQEKFAALRKEQEMTGTQDLQQQQKAQHELELKNRKEHEARIQHTVKELEQELNQERKGFTERYTRETEVSKDTLRNHKEKFLKELYKQKRELDSRVGLEKSRGDDPFYRLRTFDAKINESPEYYTLKARVAPHEKDSVDVIVKDDRIILSARRQFQDAVDADGIKSSTNTYQTYRQEFALAQPVDAKRVVKSVDENGNVTAYIPKQPTKPQAKT